MTQTGIAGPALRALRQKVNMTVGEVAREANVPAKYLAAVEAGREQVTPMWAGHVCHVITNRLVSQCVSGSS